MILQSISLKENHTIPEKHTARGGNISPALTWISVPRTAVSLALIMADVDAPINKRFHWGICNISPLSDELTENLPDQPLLPGNIRQLVNDMGKVGYYGPGFPDGMHHYIFRLFALDTMLQVSRQTMCADMLKMIKGHILAFDTITVLYSQGEGLTMTV